MNGRLNVNMDQRFKSRYCNIHYLVWLILIIVGMLFWYNRKYIYLTTHLHPVLQANVRLQYKLWKLIQCLMLYSFGIYLFESQCYTDRRRDNENKD